MSAHTDTGKLTSSDRFQPVPSQCKIRQTAALTAFFHKASGDAPRRVTVIFPLPFFPLANLFQDGGS